MKKIIACTVLLILASCGASPDADSQSETENQDSISTSTDAEEVEEKEQTVEERVAEIKELYAMIQKADKKKQKCSTAKSTTMDGLMEDMQYPFENTAQQCTLPDGYSYQTLELRGYEWAETAHFYFKDEALFFTFIEGGAEACGYEYRVYYNRSGEVIRVLSAENECDGGDLGKSKEVKEEKNRKEILDAVKYCQKEFAEISAN